MDIGDFAGGAALGAIEGMNEGTILVSRNAGHRTGDHMRRGMLVVKGGAGDHLGSRMKGGTIVVLGPTGRSVGLGMRRGTIVLGQRPVEIPATFHSSGKLKMEFLRLLFRELGRSFWSLAFLRTYGPLSERLIGDLSAGGGQGRGSGPAVELKRVSVNVTTIKKKYRGVRCAHAARLRRPQAPRPMICFACAQRTLRIEILCERHDQPALGEERTPTLRRARYVGIPYPNLRALVPLPDG
jgi:hypothetical protein